MRVGVVHNLPPGGARRRLSEQICRLQAEIVELCPSSGTPIRADARVFQFDPVAPRIARPLRVPLRYLDLGRLLATWRRIAAHLAELRLDAVYANPCRYLQAPPALLGRLPPSLYFCDEPRRVDHDPEAKGTVNLATRPVYAPMYAAQRRLDQRAVARATHLGTNSSFTASEIQDAYGRRADVVPMGVSDLFRETERREPSHVLSVGALIPSKGHEIVIAAAAGSQPSRPVVVVSPQPGPGEEARLREIARELGVTLTVRVGISDRVLAETYASAQATVYMAAREPFGLASLEAQATGCPVVVAAEGGLPETIIEGRTGWAVARSPAAVSSRLELLEHPGVREEMAEAAREHAAGASWIKSAQAVQTLLANLAG